MADPFPDEQTNMGDNGLIGNKEITINTPVYPEYKYMKG